MIDGKKSKEQLVLLINIVLALLLWIGDCVYVRYSELWIKSITSAMFVAMGAANLAFVLISKNKNIKFPILMTAGLLFAMLGDVILEIEFIVGAALFALGHVLYFVAYAVDLRVKPTDFIYCGCILVPSVLLITLAPIFDFGGALMEVVCVVYAVVLSCMVGKAIANCVRVPSKKHLAIAIGSVLFFISDFSLLFNKFSALPYFGVICLATYYPAEALLALSVFLHNFDKPEPVRAEAETAKTVATDEASTTDETNG